MSLMGPLSTDLAGFACRSMSASVRKRAVLRGRLVDRYAHQLSGIPYRLARQLRGRTIEP